MINHEEHDKQAIKKILSDIDEFGCHLAMVEADDYSPAFVYTIGLFKNFKHPEIIIFGLSVDVMGHILNHLKDEIANGSKYDLDRLYSNILSGYDVQFLEVAKDNYQYYLGYAGWYYDHTWNFPVLEIIWPDKNSRWPWELEFNENWKFKQPLLDRDMDYKFLEDRNLGVYTTKHVLEGKPILYVYHNADGDWQFHSEYEPDLNDSKLVALEEIVKIDPSVNEVHYLNFGQSAYRSGVGEKWIVE